ncbi:hypothetical protein IC582_017561 [Cucumis melo]|uniref:Uncharacterized protein LOC103494832 n=2 Tax=Cucumis melo TaxID=3656 RepID=A0A1S3BY38_CUCME|nr:uncharacterized protein LOC103494832 [Cucumis melo]XP_008454423.1 uncharacterized protein LOC103494832 [Cucumis melo]XP_050943441.1 uncharacterized protein LOC103494832 [Cucumis melo]XP_050943442.1 uncharacterized protein LOC103494832 [Cucumis melo]
MASLQILKSTLSLPSISHPNFGSQSTRFFSDFDSLLLHGRRRSLRVACVCRRFSFRCAAKDADKESNGEEPPESLFMKELKKRGITPTSLLEDTNNSDFGLGGEMTGENRDFSRRSAVSTEVNKSLSNQRERSMQLNSEGLEGLIPRAKLLLTIGGTFFLGFWPLIIITVSFFFGLYFFFGSSFIHDGKTPISPPPYVDPYALLEDERISQIAPPVN